MRAPLPLLAVSAVVLLGACDQAVATGPEVWASPSPSPTVRQPLPAAEAGGVCVLLDYGLIDEALGVRFDVAAAGHQGKTRTCVVQSSEASLPDLVLTVSPTTADASVFRSDMAPDGAQTVTALGKAAYRSTIKAAKRRGPAAEVGWLSADKRLLTLRYTTPVGTPAAAAQWHGVRLVALAKRIDKAAT